MQCQDGLTSFGRKNQLYFSNRNTITEENTDKITGAWKSVNMHSNNSSQNSAAALGKAAKDLLRTAHLHSALHCGEQVR